MMLLLKITFLAFILVKNVDCSFELVDQNGNTITTEGEEGLLLYNGGTVCDDHYDTDDNASNAVCKLMGFEAFTSHTNSDKWSSLQEIYSITLDDVICSSAEWSSCTYVDSEHNCGHSEDVFLTRRGVCSPGQHRSSGTCVHCPSNTFKVETGIQRCISCPEGAISQIGAPQCVTCPTGSRPLDEGAACSCEAGWIWNWTDRTSGSCTLCTQETYKSEAMQSCLRCPDETTSIAGSTYCSCKAGLHWNQTRCYNCSEGSSSPDGSLTCTECPSGSTPLQNGTSCSCEPGRIWSWDGRDNGSCELCPLNTYKDNHILTCTACPKFSSSTEGSASCKCTGGMFLNRTIYKDEEMLNCAKCPESSASPEGASHCLECTAGSNSLNSNTACSCPRGMIWNWTNLTSGSCSLCPPKTHKDSQLSACTPCGKFSQSTAGSERCTCVAGTYKNPNMTSCTMCPEGTSSESDSEHCTCSAGQFWNGTLCEICNVGSVSLIGALKCQQCPPGTSADTMMSTCTCREGMTWSWSDQGDGSCASIQPFHTSLKNQTKISTILAGALGLSVLLSLLLGLLLFYEKRNGRKQATGPRVVYTAEGEVGIGDQQSGASGDVEDPRKRQVIENEAVCHVSDVEGSKGNAEEDKYADEDIYADEEIYDTIGDE